MEPPLGTPIEWVEVVKKASSPDDLYARSLGKENRFSLLSAAIDDASWVERGGASFVRKMLEEWNREEVAPEGLAEEIRRNSSHILSLLPETLSITVGGKEEHVFPLLFQETGGTWFRGLYQHYALNRVTIPMDAIPVELFPFFKEYCYTGKVETLWKEEEGTIEALHALAEKYDLKGLSEYVFRTFKNYLSDASLATLLKKALREKASLFAAELCELLNARIKGATFSLQGNGLELYIKRVSEEVLGFEGLIRKLTVEHAEELPRELLKGVVSLKLSGSVYPKVLEESPPETLEELDLSETLWGWELIQAWASHLPRLRILLMRKTPPLPASLWPLLEHLKGLKELDLSYQGALSPTFTNLLHATFPNLERLIVDET